MLCRLLPGLAVLMLTAGPASSAADAAYRGRVADLAETQRAQSAIDGKSLAPSAPGSDSAPKREKPSKHEADGASAYLVPAVAKPTEAKSTDFLAACSATQSSLTPVADRSISCSERSETLQKQLHRPAYVAHAPPADQTGRA